MQREYHGTSVSTVFGLLEWSRVWDRGHGQGGGWVGKGWGRLVVGGGDV